MVSALGLLDGLTASGIILSSVIFGLLSLYKAKKLHAKLLAIAALTMFFVGCLWLGPFVDFIMVLFFNTNITPIYYYSLLSYANVAPALIFAMYLGGSLLAPKKKWIIVGIYIVLGVIFEYFLWFQNNLSFTFTLGVPGEDLIDAEFVRNYYTFYFVAFFLVSSLIFLGIGFAVKAKQSTGELRKKFMYLSLGFIIFVVCGALDSILKLPVAIGVVRGVMMTFALWMYLGLKT
ncbi:MAG: hypothetical protein EU552_02305 [Promethearchaeota archaeon]|nr:MAG: hypothetical protein EU552_02305 [Candidatus Lokiarchaeota archaeon]